MKSLLELIKLLYGPKALSQTIGTRTNVISLTNKKFEKYIKTPLNIEEASDAAAVNAYKEMEKLVVDVPKMNDSERLIFEGNLRRTKNKLQASGLIPPDETAEIVSMGTKEPVSGKGVEKLLEESGQTAKPGTLIGDLESRINRLKSLSKEGMKTEDVLKDFATGQKGMLKLQNEGLVRATARQIMFSDIKSGKLKVSKEVEDIILGKASGDPIDSFRTIYGEDALEQLDSLTPELGQLRTEIDAEKLARSKFKFEPDVNRPPGSISIEEAKKAEQEFGINKPAKVSDFKKEATRRTSVDDLIDEYNANQDRLLLTDDEGGTLITYPEYNRLKDRNEEIAKVLEEKGISSKVEVKPEGTIIPFKKDDPDKFAKGGSAGLGYLVGLGTEDTTRENFGIGSIVGSLTNTVKAVTNPAAGLMIRLDRPPQPGDPVGSYYIPPGDGSGLTSIIRAVPQPSAPSITLDAKPAVVRPEDDVVNRYREYFNASKPVQSDLEKRYRELVNPPKQELMVEPMTKPLLRPDGTIDAQLFPIQGGLSFTSPQGEKITFSSIAGFRTPEGKSYDGPVPENILNSSRMIAADGGRIGFEKGSIPEEEDQEPSEEYIKSRKAGRFKYSFDVQGPDSRIKKSGLPGRTNPKDYGLGLTYLPNPGNETAPEIRVGGSRRGAGIEIRKRFKDGGLGYLVGE